jgi:two-component system NarL family sensor kinase
MEYSSAMPIEIADLTREIGVYIRLVWLFVVIITALMLLLCYLYLAKRKALAQESASLEFSNQMIEGMETERRRISRELHDTVLPLVSGETHGLVREICMKLMPPDFTRLSLKDSLAGLCMQFTQKTGVECLCYIEEEVDFSLYSTEDQLHLYRIAQESINNIEKHSGTDKATLIARRSVQTPPDNILILISDEGPGLQSNGEKGLGIRSMRQRAAIIGANIDFISDPGNGLIVRIEVTPPPEKEGA